MQSASGYLASLITLPGACAQLSSWEDLSASAGAGGDGTGGAGWTSHGTHDTLSRHPPDGTQTHLAHPQHHPQHQHAAASVAVPMTKSPATASALRQLEAEKQQRHASQWHASALVEQQQPRGLEPEGAAGLGMTSRDHALSAREKLMTPNGSLVSTDGSCQQFIDIHTKANHSCRPTDSQIIVYTVGSTKDAGGIPLCGAEPLACVPQAPPTVDEQAKIASPVRVPKDQSAVRTAAMDTIFEGQVLSVVPETAGPASVRTLPMDTIQYAQFWAQEVREEPLEGERNTAAIQVQRTEAAGPASGQGGLAHAQTETETAGRSAHEATSAGPGATTGPVPATSPAQAADWWQMPVSAQGPTQFHASAVDKAAAAALLRDSMVTPNGSIVGSDVASSLRIAGLLPHTHALAPAQASSLLHLGAGVNAANSGVEHLSALSLSPSHAQGQASDAQLYTPCAPFTSFQEDTPKMIEIVPIPHAADMFTIAL